MHVYIYDDVKIFSCPRVRRFVRVYIFFRLTSAFFLPRSSAILPLFFRDFDPHKLNNRHGSKSATTATTKNIIITMITTMKKVITKLNTPTAWGNLRKFHSFFRDFFRGLEGIAAHVFSDRLRFWDGPCIYEVYSTNHATTTRRLRPSNKNMAQNNAPKRQSATQRHDRQHNM